MNHQRRTLLKATGLLGLAAFLPGMSAASSNTAVSVARTRAGRVTGRKIAGVHVFKGVRYGADTSTRRFRAPLPPAPWRGVHDATEYGASAPQTGSEGPGSEDCLFLNVWTPALRDGRRRPILFYIHGGSYNTGSGSSPLYDGTRLCLRGDVVVVTVNHRLNTFGYLYLDELAPEYAGSGNVGQLDLILALQWVREHAAEFGGDADNITVFGQSGGGAKIATLMAMPAATGLFHKAMTMSGQQVTAAGPRAATRRTRLLLDELGIAHDDITTLARLPMTRLLQGLRTRDPSPIENMALYLGPVLDNVHLPVHPFHPEAPQQSAAIPMVIGNTRDETRAFLGNDPRHFNLSWDDLPDLLQRQQYVDLPPAEVIAEYRRLYPHYTPSEVFFAATTAGRSWRGAVLELEARARQRAPTWAYQLDWYPDSEDGRRLRAFHTLDIPLVFDNIAQPGSSTGNSVKAQAVADAMSDALIALAHNGSPASGATADWQPYTLERRQTMVFAATPELQDDPRGGERRLYERAPFVQRGTF